MFHIYQNRVQINKILTIRLCLAVEPYFQGICSLEPPFQVFSYLFQILESWKLYGSVFNAIIWLKTIRLSSNNVLIFYIIFILINVVPLVPRRDWPISYQFLSQASSSFTATIYHIICCKKGQKLCKKEVGHWSPDVTGLSETCYNFLKKLQRVHMTLQKNNPLRKKLYVSIHSHINEEHNLEGATAIIIL